MARSHAPDRFRFYFADVGSTKEWGNPVSNETLAKMALNYQIAPLRVERDPFDIYFVDGRWRVACVMASFLHAIQSGGDMNTIRVVLHDYAGRGGPTGSYGFVESIATIEQRSEKAIVLAKKDGVSKADIFNAWEVRGTDFNEKELCLIELIRECNSLYIFMLLFNRNRRSATKRRRHISILCTVTPKSGGLISIHFNAFVESQ
jgi:hypothetical protein